MKDDSKHSSPSDVDEDDVQVVMNEHDDSPAEQKIKEWRDKYKACDAEKRAVSEEMQRIRADFLNSRRMLEEQLAREKERLNEYHGTALLPLCDSFDMAISDPSWEAVDEKWRVGVTGVYTQLKQILKDVGIESIDAVGVPFDPNIHEAVQERHEDGTPPDTVLEVFQKGYRLGEHILRPAKVIVSGE